MIIIVLNILIEDARGMLYRGDIFSDTGSDQPVLEPPIGAFDFYFSRR